MENACSSRTEMHLKCAHVPALQSSGLVQSFSYRPLEHAPHEMQANILGDKSK